MVCNPEIAILKDTRSFAALKEDWEELYHDCALSTPFQSWSWLYSWWEAFGEGYELRLITVREGSLLVGLIPLMLEHRWGFRRLVFLGDLDQPDIVARKGWEDKVSKAGIRAIRQMNSWHVIAFRDVSPTATSWNIFQQWNGPRTQILTDYLFIHVQPWDRLLTFLSRKHRNTIRRTLRRAKEDGVCRTLARPGEAEQAARRLVALHRELRHGRDICRKHMTPKFESFIVAAARRMTDSGLGRILEFRRDGEVIISSFTLFGERITYAYLVGVSQEAMRRYQWSSLGIYGTLTLAQDSNSAYVCLAQAADPYKQRWPHEKVPYYQIVLGRGSVSWSLYSLYSMYLSLRAWAGRRIRSDSTPNFIKKVAERLRRR
jgi:CelD/BcsL family acetyltransferase involved in cellulose biosynthesis